MPSTVIRRFAYDPPSRVLTVEFTSGDVYSYLEVPPELPPAWRAAYSKGRFFAARVRDHYPCRKLNGWPGAEGAGPAT